MSSAVFRAAIQERLRQPLTWILVAALALVFPVLGAMSGTMLDSVNALPAMALTLVLLSGAIGRDVSAGTLPLLLVRPIRRIDYVLAKWLALSLLAAIALNLQLGTQAVAIWIFQGAPKASEIWRNAVERLVLPFGLGAVLVFFSSFMPKSWDVAAWFGSLMFVSLLGIPQLHVPDWIPAELKATLEPELGVWHTFYSHPVAWGEVARYLSTIALALSGAVLVMNRKEVSYAAG